LTVGGLNRAPYNNPQYPASDNFQKTREFLATADWQPFEIPLPPATELRHVLQGFAVTIADNTCTKGPAQIDVADVAFDNLRPEMRGLIRSFLPKDDKDEIAIRNSCFVYDVDLAGLAFLSEGTPDGYRRARILANAIVLAQEHDAFYKDGRIRNAYMCGPI